MSFASDLKKVSNLDEGQYLFESEVYRISKLTIYRQSKTKYEERLLKIQNDIYRHLDSLNIKGILYVYDYMLYDNLDHQISDDVKHDDDGFTKSDRAFFRRLWAFIAVYSVCFVGFAIYANHFVKPISSTVSRETRKSKTENKVDDKSSVKQSVDKKEDDNEIVYNKYRSQNTTKKILKEDEAWANR